MFEPRDYQRAAIDMLHRQKKVYWMLKPGRGKTGAALLAIREAFDDFAVDRVLVVGPKRVVNGVWQRDAAKWGFDVPMRLLTVDQRRDKVKGMLPADPKVVREQVAERHYGIDLISKDHFPALVKALGVKRWPYLMVVWDEASGIKDHSTVRFKAMRHLLPSVEYLLLLSGTPRPNSEEDLWPAIYLLDEGQRLGRTLTSYREQFFAPDKRGRDRVYSWRCTRPAEVHEAISDICFAADVPITMPAREDVFVKVHLPPDARRIYEDLREFEVSGDIVAANRAVLAGKLTQLNNGAIFTHDPTTGKINGWREVHSGKIDALREILADGEPTIVAYWFEHDLSRLRAAFPDGEVFTEQRQIDRWIDGEIPLLFLHPGSAGHGVDGLQLGGNRLVWFSLTWSAELYEQTVARLQRHGSPFETMQNFHLVCTDSNDEDIQAAIERKSLGQEAMLLSVARRHGKK